MSTSTSTAAVCIFLFLGASTSCCDNVVIHAFRTGSSPTPLFTPPFALFKQQHDHKIWKTTTIPSISSSSSSSRQARSRAKIITILSSKNGGMDAYDAQMAAIMSASSSTNDQPTTTATSIASPSMSIDADTERVAAEMINSSRRKWNGQNSYMQQLLPQQQQQQQDQQQPEAIDNGSYSPYTTWSPGNNNDNYYQTSEEEASYGEHISSAGGGGSDSDNNEDADDDDPYEMQFTNYLLNLQHQLEQDEMMMIRSSSSSSFATMSDDEASAPTTANNNEEELSDILLDMVTLDQPSVKKVGGGDTTTATTSSSRTERQLPNREPTLFQVAKAQQQQQSPSSVSSQVQQQTASSQSTSSSTTTTTTTESPTTSKTEQQRQQQQPSDYDEDKFLQMVSNEIAYKKLKQESPYSLTDIEIPVLLQRFLDNIEDGTQKNNGKFKGQSKMRGMKLPKEERKTVVVLGSGWASHAFVKLASTYDLRIVVVSPVNHFVFTPMLASAAVGTVEYRSMTEPIRVTNPYIDNFVEGRAIGVDVEAKKVQVQLSALSTVTGAFKGIACNAPCRLEPEPVLTQIVYSEDGSIQRDKTAGAGAVIELNYDHLICAVGTASRSSIVPGAKEYCFNLKTSQDSKRLRTAIGEALEMACRPDVQEFYYPDELSKSQAREERQRRVRIAVVGGGPTGVELSGEMCDFFAQMTRSPDGAYQHLKDDISVTLIHGGSELLPGMDKELRCRALEALQDQGVDIRLNTRLQEVGQDYIKICEKGNDVVETIPLGITVWAAGNAPVPFVKELLSQLPESAQGSAGRINVDQWLRCTTYSANSFGSLLVLGDVACFDSQPKYESEPRPLPQTAQVAGQQGAFIARLLNRGYDMSQSKPKLPELSSSEAFSLLRFSLTARGLEEAPGFKFLSLGLLAYVGQEEALNQVMLGDVPIFNFSGKIAFALWRSVYLTKQASSRNQALIAFDWLRSEMFGRDITRL